MKTCFEQHTLEPLGQLQNRRKQKGCHQHVMQQKQRAMENSHGDPDNFLRTLYHIKEVKWTSNIAESTIK
jgi:hypothetical protein